MCISCSLHSLLFSYIYFYLFLTFFILYTFFFIPVFVSSASASFFFCFCYSFSLFFFWHYYLCWLTLSVFFNLFLYLFLPFVVIYFFIIPFCVWFASSTAASYWQAPALPYTVCADESDRHGVCSNYVDACCRGSGVACSCPVSVRPLFVAVIWKPRCVHL